MEDEVNVFIEKAETADGFVFGSPVHFAAASGNLTSFLDRAFYGRGELFKGKIAASVNKYALMSNMYLVGSSYWNQIHGNNKEEAKQDLEGLQTMRNLGKNMAYLLKCIDLGKKQNIQKPEYEKTIRTNFIR